MAGLEAILHTANVHTFPASSLGHRKLAAMWKVMVEAYGLAVAVARCPAFQPGRHFDGKRSATLLAFGLPLSFVLRPWHLSIRLVSTGFI